MRQAHERIIGERQVDNEERILSVYEGHAEVCVREKAGAEVEFGSQSPPHSTLSRPRKNELKLAGQREPQAISFSSPPVAGMVGISGYMIDVP